MSDYWSKRLFRHLQLAAISALLTLLVYELTPSPDSRHRLSIGSAYAAVVFLGWALLLGPWNLLRSRPNPVSFDLRRDIGIWSGILALLHTGVGLTVHLRGRMWMYFFKKLHPLTLQKTLFGFANSVGLLAALLFVFLLVISNDQSVRALGLQRWKAAQRTTYAALALTFLHGWAYQSIEKRKVLWIAVFWLMGAVIAALQLAGMRRGRKKTSSTLHPPGLHKPAG